MVLCEPTVSCFLILNVLQTMAVKFHFTFILHGAAISNSSCSYDGMCLICAWSFFFFCPQNRQLQGLKGLFNKNPRHSSSENNSHYIRKRSIGDRILRRTASAPAKGRKKSKVGFQEMVEIKDSVSEATREQDGVLRRTTRSLQVRPVSMPVDKSLLGALSLPISEAAKDTDGKENSLGKVLSVSLSCIFVPCFHYNIVTILLLKYSEK